jgi:hypothetical protein
MLYGLMLYAHGVRRWTTAVRMRRREFWYTAHGICFWIHDRLHDVHDIIAEHLDAYEDPVEEREVE